MFDSEWAAEHVHMQAAAIQLLGSVEGGPLYERFMTRMSLQIVRW